MLPILMILPPCPRRIIFAPMSCVSSTMPCRLVCRMRSYSSRVKSPKRLRTLVPETLTRISTSPAASAAARMEPELVTSRCSARELGSCLAVASSLSMERAARMVFEPAAARACTMERPMPRLAPATNAVFPEREKMLSNGFKPADPGSWCRRSRFWMAGQSAFDTRACCPRPGWRR